MLFEQALLENCAKNKFRATTMIRRQPNRLKYYVRSSNNIHNFARFTILQRLSQSIKRSLMGFCVAKLNDLHKSRDKKELYSFLLHNWLQFVC